MNKFVVGGIGVSIVIIVGVVLVQQIIFRNESLKQETTVTQDDSSKIRVIASFYPLYEFSKNIGGDKALVSVFTPIGVEPHDWEPSTGNLVSLEKSDIFVYNGGGMEPFVKKIIDSGEYHNVLFVDTTRNIEFLAENANDGHVHQFDPHVWLDPISAKEQVTIIKNAMVNADPKNEKYYEDNANAYSLKLDNLDSKIKNELANCTKDTIVPFHNAFSYFGSRYGIHIHALSGLTPESEVSASDLRAIIDYIKENNIKIVFAEDLVDPKLAQVLADEAGTQILVLSPLEGIKKEEQQKGVSYFDKMEENLMNIKLALECT
ncbi:MAG: metal ABC transporter solute-binding protein, Zn/Mn family [Candidatus Nitrosotenuis sp.]